MKEIIIDGENLTIVKVVEAAHGEPQNLRISLSQAAKSSELWKILLQPKL
ncbi:MAG: hypothetical protein H7Z37_14685 [Pyrinomonadaceae bacterium]|nr:hypothetical protein [Pyrinomonadaceae bacterium]